VNLQFRDYEDSDLDRRYVYVRMSRKLGEHVVFMAISVRACVSHW